MLMTEDNKKLDAIELATELTIAWLSNPNTRAQASDVPDFLKSMHEAVSGLTSDVAEDAGGSGEGVVPAVSIRKSLASPEHIISLIDGKPYKTLRRHLSNHGLTPEEYRQRYGLKADYPMVAPAYAERRRSLAKAIGLGRKPKETPAPSSKARGRPRRKGDDAK